MQFTAQEMKLIDRLRKEEGRWSRTRWILLAAAAFLVAVYGYVMTQVVGMLQAEQSGESATLVFALVWPKCLLGFCGATWLVVLAIRDWHGNVQRMLLLRMLDARQKESAKDDNAG